MVPDVIVWERVSDLDSAYAVGEQDKGTLTAHCRWVFVDEPECNLNFA